VKKYWQYWRRATQRIDAMSLRERGIIFLAMATLLFVFVYLHWIDAEFARSKTLSGEIAQRQAEMKALQDQITKMVGVRQADPDRANRERLASVHSELARVQERIVAEERKFTAPAKMRAVLEELLAKNRRVSLVSLRTLPMTSIAEERAAGAQGGAPQKPSAASRMIFRHGVELTVSGGYLDILAYLAALEKLPTQLYWNALGLESRYPTVTVKIIVFTLSLDRAWLSV
jgi:MSHA biogenesis protein MshJ